MRFSIAADHLDPRSVELPTVLLGASRLLGGFFEVVGLLALRYLTIGNSPWRY